MIFPKSYLKAVPEGVGDWAIYHEPVKAGRRGYFAAAQIRTVVAKPGQPGRFLALIAPGSFQPFVDEVPRLSGWRCRGRCTGCLIAACCRWRMT